MPTITSETLNELDQSRKNRIAFIQENDLYVEGRNPTIINDPPTKKPDNRIPTPLAKIAVNRTCGFAGRAGDIKITWEDKETNDVDIDTPAEEQYNQIQKDVSEHNDSDLETSKQYKTALTQGESYQLFWVSDNLDLPGMMTPEYTKVSNAEMVLVWSRDLKPKLTSAIRFTKDKEDSFADVYYPLKSEHWQKLKGATVWSRNTEGDTKYPYTEVPLAVYKINEKALPLFQAEKDLIDGNDKILNNTINEVDRFNALIALFPGLVDKDFRDKLIDVGVIDDLDQFEKWPAYLQKNLTGISELYAGIKDRVEKWFFQGVGVPDFSNERFGNADSGKALMIQLIDFEFLASTIEIYFLKGLQQKNKLINDVIAMNAKIKPDDFKMVVKTQRNIPVDELSQVEIAQKLMGLVSEETLLKWLPKSIVDDVKKEIERKKKERENMPDVDLDDLTVED